MSATTAGAVKALLESKGRGVPWFRDRAPKDQPLPFGVIQEGIGQSPVRMGDTMDQTAERVVVEMVQATLFQAWRGPDGKPVENYPLVDLIWKDLDGALLPGHPKAVSGVKVLGRVRLPQVDGPDGAEDTADGANVVQDTYTLTLHRSL